MRRLLMASLPLCGAVALLAAANGLADTVVLTTEGATQTSVTFQHRAHALERGVPCTRCHHNMATDGTKPCAECHPLTGAPEDHPSLEKAFHGQCLGCHETPPKDTAPPVECAACHVPATDGAASRPATPPSTG